MTKVQSMQINTAARDLDLSKKRKKSLSLSINCILILLLIVALIISICTGRYSIPIPQLINIILGKLFGIKVSWPPTVETVLFNVRLPRIIVAIMVGSSLATAGSTYQGLFKNPMVSPDILGATAGAGFGAAVGILCSLSSNEIQISAFVFGIAAVSLSYSLSKIIGRKSNVTLILVLTGMVVQSMFTAFISITKYVADPESKLPAITFWLMGGLNTSTWKDVTVMIIPLIIASVPLFLLRYKINVLSFGDEEAQAMGVDTNKIRIIIIICSTLLTASAVSVCGMVGWVGLIIPHIARIITGPNYKKLLPASFLIGGTYLLLIDDIARSLFVTEIPLGILTSIIGAPFFLFLLIRGKNKEVV
ncbi:MAG: iron ABC transporter permease [Bacillota bacterium]|nr:iron ABC transporter permease [Bacillota bacterium]